MYISGDTEEDAATEKQGRLHAAPRAHEPPPSSAVERRALWTPRSVVGEPAHKKKRDEFSRGL